MRAQRRLVSNSVRGVPSLFRGLIIAAALSTGSALLAASPSLDLQVSTSVSPASPTAGAPFTLTSTISRVSGTWSDGKLQELTATTVLPSGVSFTATGSDSRCSVDSCGSTVTCALGEASSTTVFGIKLTASQSGPLTFVTGVASRRYDPNIANNTAVTSITVGSASTYSISGTVMSGGVGLAGVVVTASSGTSTFSGTTISAGSFVIPGVPNGSYNVVPSRPGYAFSPSSQSVTVAGGNVSGVLFGWTATGFTISGVVRRNGVGLAGVVVRAGSYSAATNQEGLFAISGLPPSHVPYNVTPEATGFTFNPTMRSVTISDANQSGIEFEAITSGYSISGRITENLVGLGEVDVHAYCDPATYTAETTADGSYLIGGLPSGSYTLTPSLSDYGFSPVSRTVTIASANLEGEGFEAFRKTHSIGGRVTINNQAAGLPGVLVTAGGRTATTNSAGYYEVTGLLSATYLVSVSRSGFSFATASQSVSVSGEDRWNVNFDGTGPTHSISGNVSLVSGAALSGVLVSAGAAVGTTDSTGSYTIPNLADWTYTVAPQKNGYNFTPLPPQKTVSGADVTGVNFAATQWLFNISGTVRLNGVGLAGVTVSTNGATATTDSNGAYTLTGLPNGSYPLTLLSAGYSFTPATSTQTIANANKTGVDFTANYVYYVVSGKVTELEYPGYPVSGVTVSLTGSGLSKSTTTNSSGNYTFTGIRNGTYSVKPYTWGYRFVPVSHSVTVLGGNQQGLNFQRTPVTYTVYGHVSFNGYGLAGVTVVAGNATATTNASGDYVLVGVQVGVCSVWPSLAGYSFEPETIDLYSDGFDINGVDFTATQQ